MQRSEMLNALMAWTMMEMDTRTAMTGIATTTLRLLSVQGCGRTAISSVVMV